MPVKCKWDESHLIDPNKRHRCDFLCNKCYSEIYLTYSSLYSLPEFERNIDLIKKQREKIESRRLSEAEESIYQMLGIDMLVKIDLAEQGLV